MTLKFFNTLTKRKEIFKPIEKGKVKMYNCGPTVYNYPHIGNYRTYIFADLIKRVLKFKGFEVLQVMNITDVDDKTIRDSQKEHKPLKEFTEFYTKGFMQDLDKLNIDKAEIFPKATETIKEMVDIIKILLNKGYAYKTDDGIYFSVKKFKSYGKLSGVDLKNLKAGASNRVTADEYDKENVSDFALWKFYTKEDGEVFWNTEFGKGRPGWHIECSAMAMKTLGKTLDIHTGGVDNLFPHHENEIAQSESANEVKFANYWLHSEHLLVDGKKMSKSLGNFYRLKDLEEKSYTALELRYLFLTTHYKQKLNFTLKNLNSAKNTLERLKNIVLELKDDGKENKKYLKEFEKAIDDDLNIPNALQVLWKLVRDKNAEGKYKTIKEMDKVFGLDLFKQEKIKIPNEIQKLVEEREKARENKDWKKSDELREKINKLGYSLEDKKEGIIVKKDVTRG